MHLQLKELAALGETGRGKGIYVGRVSQESC